MMEIGCYDRGSMQQNRSGTMQSEKRIKKEANKNFKRKMHNAHLLSKSYLPKLSKYSGDFPLSL